MYRKLSMVLATSALFGGASVASAAVINGDFNEDWGGGVTTTYSGQGAFADTGNDYWNGIGLTSGGVTGFTTGALSDSTGAVTSVTLVVPTMGSPFTFSTPFTPNDLMNEYGTIGGGATATFAFEGLAEGDYTLYLYGATFDGEGTTFTVGGESKATDSISTGSLADVTGAMSEGHGYVVFDVTVNSSGVLSFDVSGNQTPTGAINGFQLLSAVPEPTSFGLVFCGSLLLVQRRRNV